jgi:hypothetical protein
MTPFTNRTFFEQRKRLTLLAKLDIIHLIAELQQRTRNSIRTAGGSIELQRLVQTDIIETLLVYAALKAAQSSEYAELSTVPSRITYLEPRIVDVLIDWLQPRAECAKDNVILCRFKKAVWQCI